MKRHRLFHIILSAVFLLTAISCEKDSPRELRNISFNATIEQPTNNAGTKVYLENEEFVYWELNDYINIGSDASDGENFTGYLVSATPGTDFEDYNGVFIAELPKESVYFLGLHPYSTKNVIKAKERGSSVFDDVKIEFQRIQTRRTDEKGDLTFDKQIYPMVAWYGGHWDDAAGSTPFNLDFHALCGIVRIQLVNKSTDVTLKNIQFSSNEEFLSGMFEVIDYNTNQPYVSPIKGTAEKNVFLNCGDGVPFATNQIVTFYLVLPALGNNSVSTKYSLTMIASTYEGNEFKKNLKLEVRRTGITNMRALEIENWTDGNVSVGIAGNGTEERPFKIYNYNDLLYLRNCYNEDTAVGTPRRINGQPITPQTHICIMRSDIELSSSGSNIWNIGIKDFVGQMTDRSHSANPGINNNSGNPIFENIRSGSSVKGITVKSNSAYTASGEFSPFCKTNNGTIEDCAITSTTGISSRFAGLAGIATVNTGTIKNCRCSASLSAYNSNVVGGICLHNSGTIMNCQFTSQAAVPYASNVGGIVYENTGTVKECYFAGRIFGSNSNWGGIVYTNSGASSKIQTCYYSSTASITTSGNAAGIVNTLGNGTVDYCWYEGPILASSGAGIAYSVSGGKIINCYANNTYAQVRVDVKGGGLVTLLSGGSIENSFVKLISVSGTTLSSTRGDIVNTFTGGTIKNCYAWASNNNFYNSTTLTGSALTTAMSRCFLVATSQTGVGYITAANAVATSGAGSLIYRLNASGKPAGSQPWVFVIGFNYPILSTTAAN